MPDADTCFRAMLARDRRFDGVFFVAVTTTGIYCRPICPARTPGRERCRFFERAAEADRAGFRACFRCRPELAPGNASVDSLSRLARAAQSRIDAGFLNERSTQELAADLGVTSRHLRRAVGSELGVSPVELAQARRLALAKQLLQDTSLGMSEVAFASGFSSVRRFNGAFGAHFGRAPSAMRRKRESRSDEGAIVLRLDYRPPLDWRSLLEFLGERAIPGVEAVHDGELRRTVTMGEHTGWVAVRRLDDHRHCLHARVSTSLAPKLMEVVARLRALFNLDAHPEAIAEQLGSDRWLAKLVRTRPGLRVPGAFDSFETAVRAILGQQVSVRGATTLAGRFAERFGRRSGSLLFFPSASVVARGSASEVRGIGMPASRAETIVSLARAVDQGLDLSGTTAADRTNAQLMAIPGVGAWTAAYVAMRALKWPDAFPAGDLGVRKALSVTRASDAEARSQPWRPWRAYAVMHLWSSLAKGG